MSILPPAPEPRTALGRHRLLSPNAAVRVSPLCLGAMNFGNKWEGYMGVCDQNMTEEILDYFYAEGGNFIDTANNYQGEESEKWVGEWMAKRDVRDQMVVATKYSTGYRVDHFTTEQTSNTTGNGTKSMVVSVNASLKKLQTDYIDLLWVHWWDYSTSIPELMQSLNHLVASGKVLYLGASDTPAWVVSKANEYARNNGLRQFSVYQGQWSAASRDFERDIIPMCRSEGMGLTPWGALGGGKFKTQAQWAQMEAGSDRGRAVQPTPEQRAVSNALETVGGRHGGVGPTSIALAYVMQKAPYVFPIVGGRKLEHIKENIKALTIRLSDEDIKEIEGAAPFSLGFPHWMLWGESVPESSCQVGLLRTGGVYDYHPDQKAILPKES